MKVSIHAPGFGNTRPSAGTKLTARYGNARPKPSARKNRHRDHGRLGQRVTERTGHEGRRARCRNDDGEQAGKECRAALAAFGQALADAHYARADFERAKEVHADRHHQQAEAGIDQRVLQLEAPADRLARRANGQQADADRRKGDENAGRVEDAACACRAAIAVRRIDEAERLHAQDREHAGHQVQDDAADEREHHRLQEMHAAVKRRRCDGGGTGHAAGRLHVERYRPLFAAVVVDENRSGCADVVRAAPGVHLDGQARARIAAGLSAVLHQSGGFDIQVGVIECGFDVAGCDVEGDRAVRNPVGRRPVHRPRQARACGRKLGAAGCVRTAVTDRNLQCQVGLLGYADLVVADDPARGTADVHAVADRKARRHRQVDQQQDRFFIGVGIELAERQQVRRRKRELTGREAVRQRPVD